MNETFLTKSEIQAALPALRGPLHTIYYDTSVLRCIFFEVCVIGNRIQTQFLQLIYVPIFITVWGYRLGISR